MRMPHTVFQTYLYNKHSRIRFQCKWTTLFVTLAALPWAGSVGELKTAPPGRERPTEADYPHLASEWFDRSLRVTFLS